MSASFLESLQAVCNYLIVLGFAFGLQSVDTKLGEILKELRKRKYD